jgi:hypothetical protein
LVCVEVASGVFDVLVVLGLVGGKDETGPAWDDLGEASGTLPTTGEGSDAVDAANVGYGSETVGDGGSSRR